MSSRGLTRSVIRFHESCVQWMLKVDMIDVSDNTFVARRWYRKNSRGYSALEITQRSMFVVAKLVEYYTMYVDSIIVNIKYIYRNHLPCWL